MRRIPCREWRAEAGWAQRMLQLHQLQQLMRVMAVPCRGDRRAAR
jgi:hypothetical protein